MMGAALSQIEGLVAESGGAALDGASLLQVLTDTKSWLYLPGAYSISVLRLAGGVWVDSAIQGRVLMSGWAMCWRKGITQNVIQLWLIKARESNSCPWQASIFMSSALRTIPSCPDE